MELICLTSLFSAAMDDLLKDCFFKALNLISKDAKLPLLTSTFYSALMLPQCPRGMRLDVKKSSFKKVGFIVHNVYK